jgi:hypothetical protein
LATTGGLQPWLAVPTVALHSVAPLALSAMTFGEVVCMAK